MTDLDLSASERARRLAERAAKDPPKGWRPEPGDTISGVLVEMTVGGTKEWGEKQIAVLRDVDSGEEVAVWLLQTVLVEEWRRVEPQLGEIVAVHYAGKRKPEGDGKPYHHFRVLVDREGQPVQRAVEEPELPADPPPGTVHEYVPGVDPAPAAVPDDDDIPF